MQETPPTDLTQQLDAALVQQAMALITSAQRIALLAHEHPDGDCLGSALGLFHILHQIGKTSVPICADPLPPSFSFLPGNEELQQTLGDEQFDLVIALDAGELSRYGTIATQHAEFLTHVPILNLDHHISSNGCGQVNIIDPTMAATAELLVLFQQQAQLPLPTEAALCLLTGLITDTGSFQYSNTTPRTLESAAVLLRHGATPEQIVRPIFRSHPLGELRLEAAVIQHVQIDCAGQLAWSYANAETLQTANATPEMDNGCSGTLRDIEGVNVAAYFKSYDNGPITRVSMRSHAPYNVAKLCMSLGGGGHAQAAGATIELPLQEAMDLVIPELRKIVQGG